MNENNPDYVSSDKIISDLEEECDNLEGGLSDAYAEIEKLHDKYDSLLEGVLSVVEDAKDRMKEYRIDAHLEMSAIVSQLEFVLGVVEDGDDE